MILNMRIIAIDPGEKRIGIAISDPSGTIANPLTILPHTSRKSDAGSIAQLAEQNEAEIIAAYEAVGATVDQNPIGKGRPDLDVGFRGANYKVEVKMPGGRLTDDQVDWHLSWKGQKAIVRNVKEALAVIGIEI